jgi:hypothetical protein
MFTKKDRWQLVHQFTLLSYLAGVTMMAKAAPAPTASVPLRGVNIMDMGIAADHIPGTFGRNYTKPEAVALKALADRGVQVVRLSFLWERIQPSLGGELDQAYLGHLLQVLRDADAVGLKIIVDMHNYGRYATVRTSPVIRSRFGDPEGPTQAQYADAWTKISQAIKADAKAYRAIYAYDLMNEPYDLPAVPPTFVAKAPVSSFDTSAEGWKAGAATTTLERVSRDGQGALKITVPPTTGDGLVFNQRLEKPAQPLMITNGSALQVSGFVPETTSGTVKARLWMVDSRWKAVPSQIIPVTKGKPFHLDFAPPEAVWPDNTGIGLDFIVDGSDGKAPLVFYVDDVKQGALAGGMSPPQIWEAYSQAAVSAIRAQNDATLLMIEGYFFSSAALWAQHHPRKWINDPMDNLMYHAHLYMDNDTSGQYLKSHPEELALSRAQGHASPGARSVTRVKVFTDWLAAQKTRGFVGEFGWPNSHVVGADNAAAWDADAEQVLSFLDGVQVGYTLWGTGSWLSPTDNILNVYQLPPSRPFLPLSPALVLEKRLKK